MPPSQVLLATYVTFGLAVACGAYLVAVAGWELLAVGAASILAGVLYTGGPRPYGDLCFWISFATLAGLPATTAPVGLTAGGLHESGMLPVITS